MIHQLLTYGNTFCTVEHTVGKDAAEVCYLLQLKKKKKELLVDAKRQYNSKSDLFKNVKTQKHLFLIVNNQQVLLKKVAGSNEDIENTVKKAFPTIKIAEFYYEVAQNGDQNFVAICRKDYVDSLIAEYQSNGVSIIGFSLQNLGITALSQFLNQTEIKTSNSTISLVNNKLKEIVKEDVKRIEYTINDLKIPNSYVLGLSGILAYFYNGTSNHSNFNPVLKELKQQYNNHRFYALGLKSALGIIFAVLLINFMFFSNAHSKMIRLNTDVLLNSSSKNILLQLQDRVDKKEELTNNINSLSSSKTTWYLNEIGKSVPNKVQLIVIDFQPVTKSIKKGKEILVTKNTILITGTSKNNDSFSQWIAMLELKDWIDDVKDISYGNGKNSTASFEFVINIKS